jgi:hypothetical protein
VIHRETDIGFMMAHKINWFYGKTIGFEHETDRFYDKPISVDR